MDSFFLSGALGQRSNRRFFTSILWLLLFLLCLFLAGCGAPEAASLAQPRGGVVAAASPEAAEAGTEILEAGGNAADAAVAVQFALAVTEPAMSGLGGQSQFILHAPSEAPVVINGTSFSPRGTPTDASEEDLTGHRLSTVPATVRTLHYVWKHYGSGTIAWAQLLEPAIRYAEEGFVVGPFRHKVFARYAEELREEPSTRQLFLTDDGAVPDEGGLLRQPVLAKTLRRLAEHGAEDFYSGEIARQIAADMETRGGWITLDDLQNVSAPVEQAPLHTAYRGWEVYTLPPPAGGWVVLQILNLLEESPPEALAPDAPERPFRVAQALRIAHANRRERPIQDLVNYQPETDKATSKEAARQMLEADAFGETTHFSVVDGEGMAVGVTASINAYFGSRTASPALGFLYNSYMDEYELDTPDHPFALRAGAMPYSSMSPTILARDGRPHLVLGSPGSARIISAVAQVVQRWVDTDMGIEDAVAAPRLHVVPPDRLYAEVPLPDSARAVLQARGYELADPGDELANASGNPYFGGVHAVAREGDGWRGAADPRRDGAVRYVQR